MFEIHYEDGSREPLDDVKSVAAAKAVARVLRQRVQNLTLVKVTEIDIDAPSSRRGKSAE